MRLIICSACKELKPFYAKGLCRKCCFSEYQQNCKEKIKKRKRKRYLEHREEVKAKARGYFYAHRASDNARSLRYYSEHRDDCKARSRQYNKTEKGRILDRMKAQRRSGKSSNPEAIKQVINDNILKYGDLCCEKCKQRIVETYHIDHITPLIKGGDNRYENFQVLCPTCNLRKSTKIADYRQRETEGQLLLIGG